MPFRPPSNELIHTDYPYFHNKLHARYEFLLKYFGEITSGRLIARRVAENPEVLRLGVIIRSAGGRSFMTGLVHRPSDYHCISVAADEAWTTQDLENQNSRVFQFFTATTSGTIRFYTGNMGSGKWEFAKEYDPAHDARRIYDYLKNSAEAQGLWAPYQPFDPYRGTY